MKIQVALTVFLLALTLGLASASALALASASASEDHHGFFVFTTQGVENYAADPKGNFSLVGKAFGETDDYFSTNGSIYYLGRILHTISKLGPDLRPVLEAKIDHCGDVPDWLGVWNQGLLVLNDNKILYLDLTLKEVARLPLAPQQHEQITPVLHPQTFIGWKDRGYFLANTGELFILPLDKPATSAPLKPATQVKEGLDVSGFWIDPDEQTFNLLSHTRTEDYGSDLEAGEKRVILKDVVLTYRIEKPADQPQGTVIHERKEIHHLVEGFVDYPMDDGRRIYERISPSRVEGKETGVHISIMTRSTPSYALGLFENSTAAFSPRTVIKLKSFGHYETEKVQHDKSLAWITIDGKRCYVDEDMQGHILRLQPASYARLKSLPELKDTYPQAVAY